MKTKGLYCLGILLGVLVLTMPLIVLANGIEPDFQSLISAHVPRANSAAVSPDGQVLYVVRRADPSGTAVSPALVKLDAHTLEVLQSVTLPDGLGGYVALSPDGTRAYIAMSRVAGSNFFGQSRVVMVDTAAYTVTDDVVFASDDRVSRVAAHPLEEKIYVTSRMSSGRVYVLDTGTSAITLTETINVGQEPVGLAVTPDGTRVYVANRRSGTISVIDTASDTVTDTLDSGLDPTGSGTAVAVSSDGSMAYITYSSYDEGGEWQGQYRFAVLDTDPASPSYHTTEVMTTTGERLQDVALAADGAYGFLASKDTDELLVVETETHTTLTTLDVRGEPSALATGPDRNTVYVLSPSLSRITKVKLGRFHVETREAFDRPRRLAADPQGNQLYLLQNADKSTNLIQAYTAPGAVFVVDPVTLEAGNAVTLPTGIPMDLTTSPDGTELYVTLSAWGGPNLYGQDRLVIIDAETLSITHQLSFGNSGGFTRVAAHPNGEKVYVTVRSGDGKVYVFDVISPTLAPKILNVSTGPVGLAVTPDGSRVYVANRRSSDLSVIETVSDTVTTTLALPIGSSGSATSVAITPDGEKAYVSYSTYQDGTDYLPQYRVVVVDVDPASPTYHATSVITTTGLRLQQLAIITDGAYATIASKDTDELIFIDTATDTEVQRVYTGDGPVDVTAWIEPNVAYVVNSEGDSVVRVALEKLRVFLPLVMRQ